MSAQPLEAVVCQLKNEGSRLLFYTNIGVCASCRYVVARNASEAADKAQAQWGEQLVLVQELDVLDTWFSSGLWPFSTLGWPNEQAEDLRTFYPTQVCSDYACLWNPFPRALSIFCADQPLVGIAESNASNT